MARTVAALAEHLASLEFDSAPLTQALETTWKADVPAEVVEALFELVSAPQRQGSSMWAVVRSALPGLVTAVGADAARLVDVVRETKAALAANTEFRLEQQGLQVLAHELSGRSSELLEALRGVRALAEKGVDTGWFCQLVFVATAKGTPNAQTFTTRVKQLVEFGLAMHSSGAMHLGFPLTSGLSALVTRPDADALPKWLEVLLPLAKTAGREAYPLFEHSLTALAHGNLDANDLTDALKLALSMLDHGLSPTQTLRSVSDPLSLDVATELARAGVDPALALTNGLRVFGSLGWLDDDGARMIRLATELHRRGLRELLFEDGLDVLPGIEEAKPGQALVALELIELMISKDLEPGVLMRWSFPRTIGFVREPWGVAALLQFARAIVDEGLSPEPAVTYAARSLIELSKDEADFRKLSAAVVSLAKGLHELGREHGESLFRDVAKLADAGAEPQAFVDLVNAFAQLLSAWKQQGLSVEPLLATAIPAAAREAEGRPWVLAGALEAARRLASQARSTEALALLEFGVSTAASLGATGAADFTKALETVEARYAALPKALTKPGSIAASKLAGTDVTRLGEAFDTLTRLHQRHGAGLDAIADVLPELARITSSVGGLERLIETVVPLREALGEELRSIVDIATRAPGLVEAQNTFREFASALTLVPARRRSVSAFVPLSRLVASESLGTVFEAVHLALSETKERRLMLELFERAHDEASLRSMAKVLPPLVADAKPQLLDGLARVKDVLARGPLVWPMVVQPALETAKQHAGPLLGVLWSLPQRHLEREEDVSVVRSIVTQRGVKAVDVLWSLVVPALRRGVMPSLGEHRELLERYLRDVGFLDAAVYAQYVRIVTDAPAEQRAAEIEGLKQQLESLTAAVRAGEVTSTQREHPLFGIALQHLFPAAVSATKEEWVQLVEAMADRPADVTALFPKGHRATLELSAGSWQLIDGAQGLEVFRWYDGVRPADDDAAEPLLSLGWNLVTAWSEGTLARAAVSQPLVKSLLTHVPVERRPAAAYDTAAQVVAIRELVSDQLMTLVESALVAAREQDASRVDRLISARLSPPVRIGRGLVKSIAATFRAFDEGRIDKAEATRRLEAQLHAFELPADVFVLRGGADALQRLETKRVVIEPGKEVARVHAELVGQVLKQFSDCLAKALEYRASSQVVQLEVEVTKRSVHAPVGLTEGVCVARDVQLWNTPGFLQLVLWNDGVCAGGVHLLALEENAERFLCLPGINPSMVFLERVEAEVVVKALLEHLSSLAKANGFSKLWIPTAAGIHSNRHVVGDALTALSLPVRKTKSHAFSYSPYAYRIDSVWER